MRQSNQPPPPHSCVFSKTALDLREREAWEELELDRLGARHDMSHYEVRSGDRSQVLQAAKTPDHQHHILTSSHTARPAAEHAAL